MWYAECNLISGYTARGLICVVHSVQSGMCGPLCILYYHAVFLLFFLSTMASIFTAQVQNILLVYYVCRIHIKTLTRCMVLQNSHKDPDQMYGFGTISSKKKLTLVIGFTSPKHCIILHWLSQSLPVVSAVKH